MPVVLFLVLLVVYAVAEWLAHRPVSAPAGPAPAVASARIGPADIYPDEERTPGAANPDITPDNIQDTICNPHWSTRRVRPPAEYTNRLKAQQIDEYGLADRSAHDYEEDHLIPLEIGGDPRDPKNLWPEPYDTSIPEGGAHEKDKVENYLHDEVCAGRIPLREAQHEIATDWYRVYTEKNLR